MNPFVTVREGFWLRAAAAISAIMLIGAAASALFLYSDLSRAAGEGYAERLGMVVSYRDAMLRHSLLVYLGFGIAVFIAVAGFSIYYSHKVAGPLVRINYFARDVAAGALDRKVTIRKGDAIHSVAESADRCTANYKELFGGLDKAADTASVKIAEVKKSIETADPELRRIAQAGVMEQTGELKRLLNRVKL